MKIAIASDHAGFRAKEELKKFLAGMGHEVTDFGTFSEDSCDYSDFAFKVAKAVASGEAERGILICGTGIGMSIAANKVKRVRAAVCWNRETAKLSREHNDANVLCLGARMLGIEEIKEIAKAWLSAEFEKGRHERRVRKIREFET